MQLNITVVLNGTVVVLKGTVVVLYSTVLVVLVYMMTPLGSGRRLHLTVERREGGAQLYAYNLRYQCMTNGILQYELCKMCNI